MANTHAHVAICELHVAQEMAGRLIAEGAVFVRLDLAFLPNECCKAIGPRVDLLERVAVPRQVLRLVVAVFPALPETAIAPQLRGPFDPAVTALPDQRGVGLPIVLERLLVRRK